MDFPDESDWKNLDRENLDEASAYMNFFGKSFDEAVQLFEEYGFRSQEDLLYLPAPVFRFYLGAFMAYLTSAASTGDPDGASGFVNLIHFKAEHDPEILRPFWSGIEPVLKHLVEHQVEYAANWEIYGSFRSLAREIADHGFEVTFEVDVPEIVPESVSIGDIAFPGRTTSWPVALQLFHYTGIEQVRAESQKSDILRIFGTPDVSGGGNHPQFGFIAEWSLYHRLLYTIRFQFDGESINSVTFLPPRDSIGVSPEVEKRLSPEIRELLPQFFGPFPGSGESKLDFSSRLEAHQRFANLWRPGE